MERGDTKKKINMQLKHSRVHGFYQEEKGYEHQLITAKISQDYLDSCMKAGQKADLRGQAEIPKGMLRRIRQGFKATQKRQNKIKYPTVKLIVRMELFTH